MPLQLFQTGQTAAQVAAAVNTGVTSARLYTQASVQAGDTLTASTAAEQAFTSGMTVPANALMVGQTIIVKGAGIYSTNVLAPPTQRARMRVNGVTMVDTGPLSFPISLNACRYTFDLQFIVRSIGTNGTVEASGTLIFATSLTTAITILAGPSGAAGDTGNPVTIDTTVPMPVTLSCQFGAPVSGNSNSLRQLSMSTLKPI